MALFFGPHRYVALLLVVLVATPIYGQSGGSGSFHPAQAWSNGRSIAPVSSYRTGSGRPGPNFWQNQVDYTIRATLDTTSKTLHGDLEITYTNNSPNALSCLWLSLQRSSSSSDLKGTDAGSESRSSPAFSIGSVQQSTEQGSKKLSTTRVADRLQIRLSSPVEARGGTTSLTIEYSVSFSTDRLPLYQSPESGPIYQAVNWYPRVESYDDVRGWTTTNRLSRYAPHPEYATYDYYLTVPASMIVAGSGTLMNPKDVLTGDQRRRLMSARRNKRKVAVISPDNAGSPTTRPQSTGELTWHFRMNGTRDVAWAASPSFVWNATRIKRREMTSALAMSFYPASSVGPESWNRSTYHTKKSIRLYSKTLRVYPWNNAVNVAAPKGNVSSSGIAFCNPSASGHDLFSCTVREHAQNWFPRIVSSDARTNPWLHEGFATFLSSLAHQTLYEGEFSTMGPLYDVRNQQSSSATAISSRTQSASSIMAPPAQHPPEAKTWFASKKPALGLHLLREYILGKEQFDYALQQYVMRWSYRQSTPADFFRSMNNVSGQDLSWFWNGWFFENWTYDHGIERVSYVDGAPANGAEITVRLHAPLPMPVEAKIVEANEEVRRIRLPVDAWRAGAEQTLRVDTKRKISKVVLDPDGVLPDVRPANDTWTQSP